MAKSNGVTAADIKAMFNGLSVTVSKMSKGVWRASVSSQPGAYMAYRYAEWVRQSYPGHSVQVVMA